MADIDLRDAVDAAITAVDTHDPKLHASVAAITVALQAAAPLLIEQGRKVALTEAYWRIREHGSGYRAAKVFRRAWERAEANPDDERARHCLAVHEFYARGIASAADDVGGMLGCQPGEEPPLSCGCPPEQHDEAKRRAADPAERRALLARLTQQSIELGTYDKHVTEER